MDRSRQQQQQSRDEILGIERPTSFDYNAAIPGKETRHSLLGELILLPKCIVFDVDDTLFDGDTDCTWGPPYCAAKPNGDGSVTECYDHNGGSIGLFRHTLSILQWLQFIKNFDVEEFNETRGWTDDPVAATSTAAEDSTTAESGADSSTSSARNKALVAWRAGNASAIQHSRRGHTRTPIHVAYASRTMSPMWMNELLSKFRLPVASNRQAASGPGHSMLQASDFQQMYPGDKKSHLRKIASQANCRFDEMIFFDNENRNVISAKRLGILAIHVPRGITWDNFVRGLLEYQKSRMAGIET